MVLNAAPLGGLHGRDVVGLEDLGELGQPYSDEPGVLHEIQDVGEGNPRKGVPKVGSEGPADVLVGREAVGRAGQRACRKGQNSSASHAKC